jgi:hypothetical protein
MSLLSSRCLKVCSGQHGLHLAWREYIDSLQWPAGLKLSRDERTRP